MKEIILLKSNFRCRENIYICRPLRRLRRLAVEYVKKQTKFDKMLTFLLLFTIRINDIYLHLVFLFQLRHHPLPREEHFENLIRCAKAKNFTVQTQSNKALADSLDRCVDQDDPTVNKVSIRTTPLSTRSVSGRPHCQQGQYQDDPTVNKVSIRMTPPSTRSVSGRPHRQQGHYQDNPHRQQGQYQDDPTVNKVSIRTTPPSTRSVSG